MTKDEALEKKAENARELGLDYEPEPVAWITEWESQYSSGKILDYIAHTRGEKVEYTPLYTTPPQHTWVGLEFKDMPDNWMGNRAFIAGANWAAKQLKEKNVPKA